MAPTIKVTYFPFKGRAEPVRLALAAGGIDFEDERIAGDQITEAKEAGRVPFMSLPTMTVDGEVYAESGAMLRYAGKLSGLYPECTKAALKVDMVIDALESIIVGVFSDSSKEARTKFVQVTVPRYMAPINDMIAKSDDPFLLGKEMSIADIKLSAMVGSLMTGTLDHVPTTVFDKYTHVLAAHKAVQANEKIAAWNNAHK